MKMTWLGTAAAEGWPAMFCRCPSCTESAKHGGKSIRSRSQSLVNDDLLIDFPADTYLHMLHGGLNLDAVTDVIITHAHEDHFYPEDLANRQSGYTRFRAPHAFNVYGNDAVCAAYERVASVIGNDEMPQVVPMHEIFEYQPLRLAHYTVYPVLADHNPREKCYIYIICDERDGKTLLYAQDTGYLKEECWTFMKAFRFDLASLDCTHGKETARRNHMGMETCAEVKARLISEGMADEKTIFAVNHFSHNCGYLCQEEIEEAAAKYHMLAAYDGMTVTV